MNPADQVLRGGVVKLRSGDLMATAPVGANVHYGAQLARR